MTVLFYPDLPDMDVGLGQEFEGDFIHRIGRVENHKDGRAPLSVAINLVD